MLAMMSKQVQFGCQTSPARSARPAADAAEPGGGTPAQFAKFMNDELKTWGEVVRTSGAKVD
jgi:hypothetical protein